MGSAINPKVIDLSHYDRIVGDGFPAVRRAGIAGVIHKASEGASVTDAPYANRRKAAREAGLLWGAYHFIRPNTNGAQVDNFLRHADVDENTLVALDYEVDNVSLAQAEDWIGQVELKIGRHVVVYSGNTLKEKLGNKVYPFWGARRLWLAQYSRSWVVQRSWEKPWLWQFTGDGVGPQPHSMPGIDAPGGLDISTYEGSDARLTVEWAGSATHTPVEDTPHPEHEPPTAEFWMRDIAMTEFAQPGEPQESAYDGKLIDPSVAGVALPYRFKHPPTVLVINPQNGRSVLAKVIDVGPHYTDDPYFVAPGRRPRAEKLSGNHAGIDATPAVHDALGVKGLTGTRTVHIDFTIRP